ncbi:MAG: hypothetical protein E7K92_13770 [Serratia marcescens]|nr:hypothetical protein [Serratia marcescens]EJC6395478.1 hypothetical protein [Serratia marcescens]MDU7468968.1 hypothetical protein [Serratia marcescens]
MTTQKEIEFENSVLLLRKNKITLKDGGRALAISKNQLLLISCLLRDITEKKEIIKEIWPEAPWESKGNNYNQLVFQTRRSLLRAKFPPDMLVIESNNYICLNANYLRPIPLKQDAAKEMFIEQAICLQRLCHGAP